MTEEKPNKLKVRLILNPISGSKKKSGIANIIKKYIDPSKFTYEINYTNYQYHATELAQDAVAKGFNIVVAIGGDGTVNEISKALINTDLLFAIIPVGSGNGLARFLKIPLNIKKAIKVLNNCKIFKMDTIQINKDFFVNMAGVGFDAHISQLFANYGKRGFKSYVKLIFKEFKNYKNQTYQLLFDNQILNQEAFLISFANSSQFGNNAHIAPLAEINDGLIDICILKKFKIWLAPVIALQLYTKSIVKSKYYQVYKTKELEITSPQNLQMHIDGDPVMYKSIVKIKLHQESLNIIIP